MLKPKIPENVRVTFTGRKFKKVKAFAAGQTNAFPIRLGAWHTRPFYIVTLRFVSDYLRRSFINFELRAHFLDLRGLLFELRRENLHPF